MDWDRINQIRELADRTEKFRRHTDALEKFRKTEQRLHEIDKKIGQQQNLEKHRQNLDRDIFSSVTRNKNVLTDRHASQDLMWLNSERNRLLNEKVMHWQNPDLHLLTGRERFDYINARHERISERLQENFRMPAEILPAITSLKESSFNSLKAQSLLGDRVDSLRSEEMKKIDAMREALANPIDLGTKILDNERDRISAVKAQVLSESIFNLRDDAVKSRAFIEDYQKSFFKHTAALEKNFGQLLGNHSNLDIAGRRWENQIKSLSETENLLYRRTTIESAVIWQFGTEMITDSLRRANYLERAPLFSRRMLEFNDEYGRFAQDSLSRMRSAPETSQKFYEQSLEIAGSEASLISGTISELIDTAGESSLEGDLEMGETPVKSNIFRVKRYELRLKEEDTETAREMGLLEYGVIHDLCFRSARCASLIAECNRAAQMLGRKEIFTPSTTMLHSAASLSTIVADNREMFSVLVNFLHLMLYESAGSNKLRFDIANEGYLPLSPDCDVIMAIKFLRNKLFFHEQKGTEREVEKSWKDIRGAFTGLGLQHYPTKRQEFCELHVRLIVEVEKFLDRLLEAINTSEESAASPG